MHGHPDAPIFVIWLLFAIALFGFGIYIASTPAEITLKWDRRGGYWIYNRVLKATGDEKRAIAAAGKLYKVVGVIGCVIAGIHIVFVSAMLLGGVLGLLPKT